jgi:hypothetical protein
MALNEFIVSKCHNQTEPLAALVWSMPKQQEQALKHL